MSAVQLLTEAFVTSQPPCLTTPAPATRTPPPLPRRPPPPLPPRKRVTFSISSLSDPAPSEPVSPTTFLFKRPPNVHSPPVQPAAPQPPAKVPPPLPPRPRTGTPRESREERIKRCEATANNLACGFLAREARVDRGPVIHAAVPPTASPAQPSYCYLRVFRKRHRAAVAKFLGPDPKCSTISIVLQLCELRGAASHSPATTKAYAFTFDPLHCEAFPSTPWAYDELLKVLAAFPGHTLGAPRAVFSEALDTLGGTIHKDAVLDSYTQPALRAIATSQSVCPNHVPEPLFSLLQSRGLPVDPNACGAHPHPAMKALEEDMLTQTAHAIHAACTVAFMKQAKFNRLARLNPLFITLVNPVLSVRDVCRHGGPYRQLTQHITTPNLLLHDVGHYLSPAEVSALFAANPALQNVFFTGILPDEVLLGEPSWYPALYSLHRLSSTEYSFVLSEDGESYEQPYASLTWLKTNAIRTSPTVCHGVELIASKFAHKLYCVSREPPRVYRSWHVSDSPDDVILPDVDGRVFNHSSRRVPRSVFNAVLSHSMSLTTQRFSGTMAKVRTFISNDRYRYIDMDTWVALAQICFALSLDPAHLEREASVNSYAALMVKKLRRFFHLHDWLLPILVAAGLTISWGSLLLPVFGVNIPDAHVGPGLVVPGWFYGATGALASQVLALVLGDRNLSSLAFASRVAALVLPHLAYLLPPLRIAGGFTVPSYAGGIAASAAVAGAISLFDGSGPHYEVAEFIERMPHREVRRWPLQPVTVSERDGSAFWVHYDADSEPPPYAPEPPPTATTPTLPRYERGHGVGVYELPAHHVSVTPPPELAGSRPTVQEVAGPPSANEALIEATPAAAPHRDLGLSGATPRPVETPNAASAPHDSLYEATPRVTPARIAEPAVRAPEQTPVPALPPGELRVSRGQAPVTNPNRAGGALRHLFGLAEQDVFEPDAFTTCLPPQPERPYPQPTNDCLLRAFEQVTGLEPSITWPLLARYLPPEELTGPLVDSQGLSTLAACALAYHYSVHIILLGDIPPGHPLELGVREPEGSLTQATHVRLYLQPGHWASGPATPFRGAAAPPATAQPTAIHRRPTAFEDFLASSKNWAGLRVIAPWQSYLTNPQRAKPYCRDLKAGTTGTLRRQEGKDKVPKNFTSAMDSMVDHHVPRKVLLTCVLGAPGSSKSSGVVPLLKQKWTSSANHWKVSVPRVKQRLSWTKQLDLGVLSWKVSTFESSLFKTARCLIVDESSQMPNGYIDYALVKDPSITSVVVIGDVTQGNFHEPCPDATLNELCNEAQYFKLFAGPYRLYSHSIPRAVSAAIGLRTSSSHRGFIKQALRPDVNYPIVAASDTEVALYSSQGYNAYTFGTVQGERFPDKPVQISVSNATAEKVSRGHFISAMCRSNIGVIFLLTGNVNSQRALSSDPFLSGLFCGTTRFAYEDLFREELRGLKMEFPSGLFDPFVANERATPLFTPTPQQALTMFRGATVTLPLDRAPETLQALLSAPPDELPDHVKHPTALERGPATAAYSESEEYLIAAYGDTPTREDREEYDMLNQSRQFDDAPSFLREGSRNLEALFPRHRADDKITYERTIEKRLRFAPLAKNLGRFRSRLFTAPILFDGWCRFTGVDPECIPPFDADLYAQCLLENEFTKLTSKTQATLLNNADRSDADWRQTYVRIFIKSQLKVKLETLLSPFKAGQTLASFQDSVILVTGPMTRYLSLLGDRLYSPSYYYHPGHSPLQLSSWCATHWQKEESNTTNDYTAFDQSQTGEALALEQTMLLAFHIPMHVIEYYLELKLTLTCQFGELAVMRFTGEGPTLKFNSDFNAAVAGCQYDISSEQARAVSGDDLAINGVPRERPGWQFLQRYLTLVAKPAQVKVASFCSWLLTPHGAIKEPRVVFAKLLIARERGEEKLSLPSLLSEVAVGYHLGDHVFEHLDELTLGTHFWLIRYFVTHAPLRFRLLLTTRSVEEVLSRVWNSLDVRVLSVVQELSANAASLWMLESRPTRIAASVLSRMGGLKLRDHRVFDNFLARVYTY
jgi:hypothetical protein